MGEMKERLCPQAGEGIKQMQSEIKLQYYTSMLHKKMKEDIEWRRKEKIEQKMRRVEHAGGKRSYKGRINPHMTSEGVAPRHFLAHRPGSGSSSSGSETEAMQTDESQETVVKEGFVTSDSDGEKPPPTKP